MKHLLLTTIAAVVLVGTAFADPIHDAAKNGNLAGVQAELDKGVDVNAEGVFKRTPLHKAVSYNNYTIFELLIAGGTDVNAKDGTGLTPLDYAKRHPEIADLLRKHGGKTGEESKATSKRKLRNKSKESAIKVSGDWIDLYQAHSDSSMNYRLMKPFGFNEKKRYPVIVSLHGAGGKGSDNRKQLRDWNKLLTDKKRRSDYPCYVLAPQTTQLWNHKDLKNIKSIIAGLPAVDMDRIYILGHSMGGHGTFILIQIEPNYFAAAAPSAGSGLRRTDEFIDATLIKDIPIWAFHGDMDSVSPIEKGQKVFTEMKKLGGKFKFTTWRGDGHGISKKMILGGNNGNTQFSSDRCDKEKDFMKWLFSQKRTDKGKK